MPMDDTPAAPVMDAAAETAAPVSSFAADLLERQPFRGYALKECLAPGERSAVFKAEEQTLGRTVALKAMRPWPGREGAVEEFFSLAGSIARLRSPHIARGLDAGRGDGIFFLAYELAGGESLAARLARRQTGRYHERESLLLVRDLAEALRNLFDLGNPHGHLHPGNIMLGDGKPKFLDVGFAWTLAWPDDTAAFAAAPDFLPPERIRGDLNIDIRGDLYSLGAIWHLLLLGEPVFRAPTPEETLARHLEARPTPPRETDPRLSAATSNLILWLLEKDRDARPRTPKEFLRKLAAHPLLAEAGAGTDAPAADADDGEADAEAVGDGGESTDPGNL